MSALYYDCLLGLPETSDAFSTHPKILTASKNKGVEKFSPQTHPRKAPRLTRDADSASASRSRVAASSTGRNVGDGTGEGDDVVMAEATDEDAIASVVLKVEGAPCAFPRTHYLPAHPELTPL
jgi:hypothetical protein